MAQKKIGILDFAVALIQGLEEEILVFDKNDKVLRGNLDIFL